LILPITSATLYITFFMVGIMVGICQE